MTIFDPRYIIPRLAIVAGVAMFAIIAGWFALLALAPD
jgi:hypothetical protein